MTEKHSSRIEIEAQGNSANGKAKAIESSLMEERPNSA
jgi:hypothetical protein